MRRNSDPAIEVTDAELSVLERLWEFGEATIRDLTNALYPAGTASEYATVQKLLDRLAKKGAVQRHKRSPAHVFVAVAQREDLIGSELRKVASRLCEGSLTPLLTHLTAEARLTDEERERLMEWIQRSREEDAR